MGGVIWVWLFCTILFGFVWLCLSVVQGAVVWCGLFVQGAERLWLSRVILNIFEKRGRRVIVQFVNVNRQVAQIC